MENEFENFIRKKKDSIEHGNPPAQLWGNLKEDLVHHHKQKARIIRMRRIGVSMAASVIIIAGAFFVITQKKEPAKIQYTVKNVPKSTIGEIISSKKDLGNPEKLKIKIEKDKSTAALATVPKAENEEASQSIFYYTKLIETKQNEILQVRGSAPELYIKSRKSIEDMRQVYEQISQQLPKSINRKELLQRMIENLQIQEQLLDNQLHLMKELQIPNNTGDEKKNKAA